MGGPPGSSYRAGPVVAAAALLRSKRLGPATAMATALTMVHHESILGRAIRCGQDGGGLDGA